MTPLPPLQGVSENSSIFVGGHDDDEDLASGASAHIFLVSSREALLAHLVQLAFR